MTEQELREIFSYNIKYLRHEKSYTQHDLAEKTNIEDKTISSIETGRQWCSSDSLVKIANALNVEPYELLLPANKAVNFNSRKTKNLMKKFRATFGELVDTMEEFLKE